MRVLLLKIEIINFVIQTKYDIIIMNRPIAIKSLSLNSNGTAKMNVMSSIDVSCGHPASMQHDIAQSVHCKSHLLNIHFA